MSRERLFHRIVRTTGFASLGQAGAKILGLGHWVLLYFVLLGDDGYGRFAFVLAYVGIFSGLAEGGVSRILVRELNHRTDPRERGRLFAGALTLLAFQSVLFWVASLAFLLAYPSDGVTTDFFLILVYATVILASPQAASESVFRADLDIRFPVTLTLIRYVAFLIALLPWSPISDLKGVLVVWWLFLWIGSVCVTIGAFRKLPPVWEGAIHTARDLFKESCPLFFTRLSTIAYYRIDQVMLGAFFESAQLGWYASSVKLTEAAHFLPAVLLEGVYPALTQVWKESREAFVRSFHRVWNLFLGLSGAFAIAACWVIPASLSFKAVQELAPAGPSMAILSGAEAFIFLNLLLFQVLIALGQQWRLIYVTTSMMLANIGLNLFFFKVVFPHDGSIGASTATLLTEALGVVFQILLLRRVLREAFDLRRVLLFGVASLYGVGLLWVRFFGGLDPAVASAIHLLGLLVWIGFFGWLLRGEIGNLRGMSRKSEEDPTPPSIRTEDG